MQAVGAGILDLHGVDAACEIPGRIAHDLRCLDLAVEAAPGRPIGRGLGADQQRCRRLEGQRAAHRSFGVAFVVGGEGAFQRLLADAQDAGLGIGTGPDAVPDA